MDTRGCCGCAVSSSSLRSLRSEGKDGTPCGWGIRSQTKGMEVLAGLSASFPGRCTSEKPQRQVKLLTCAPVYEQPGCLPAARRRARSVHSISVPDQKADSSAPPPLRPSIPACPGSPRVGCRKARSSIPHYKLTLPHCCCWQNTYTNADKLLEAAEQLAQTGECDPEEIYKAARHLEVRIQDFVRRVEQRKLLLDMSVSFHTHTKEVRAEGVAS